MNSQNNILSSLQILSFLKRNIGYFKCFINGLIFRLNSYKFFYTFFYIFLANPESFKLLLSGLAKKNTTKNTLSFFKYCY